MNLATITDIFAADTCNVLHFQPALTPDNGVDAWGIQWEDGKAVSHPMEHMDFADILSYPLPPLPTDAQCVAFLAQVRKVRGETRQNIILDAGSSFAPMYELFAPDEFFVRCITEPALMAQMFNRIAQYHAAVWSKVLSYTREDVTAIQFTEQFGMTYDRQIRPEMYRRLIKPAQTMLVGQIKRMYPHLPVCYRCTAQSFRLIPDFAEIRFDAWEPLGVTPRERTEITQYHHSLGNCLALLCGEPAQQQNQYQYHPLRLQFAMQ